MSESKTPEISLEAPPALDSPTAEIGGLFSDASVGSAAAKVAVLEKLLTLVPANLTFHDFMREILLVIMRVVKCEAASILEVNHENQTVFFRAVAGRSSDRVSHFVIPVGQGIVGHVVESRQVLNVSNVEENKVHLKAIQKTVDFEAKNLIALPILVRGNVYGVLELLNRVGEENFTQADVELLSYICDMVSKAIEARLVLSWMAARSSGREAA